MKHKVSSYLFLFVNVFILFSSSQSLANANEPVKQPLNPVTIQLRWHHQFQFAGYYAAVYKGFYRDRGLQVTLMPGSPDRTPVNEVLSGRAQYGEANSELLYHYLKGEPLIALAAIFQHSPSVLLTREDSGINTPHQLYGKKVMMMSGTEDVDFLAMMANEGVNQKDINIIPSSFNIQDLVDGKTDAFNAYLTNEPFYLRQQGIKEQIIAPVNYGVDFYSDILFTSRDEAYAHPERVKAFREATLLGWEYAMDHKQEIIDLILNWYGPIKTRAHLEFEAEAMEDLILPRLIPIGNINPGRFQRMADIMVEFGFIDAGYSLDDFIYNSDPSIKRSLYIKTVLVIGLLLVVTTLIAVVLWKLNHRLGVEMKQRLEAEKQLRHIAYHDALTGLPNRILLSDRLHQYMAQVRRHGLILAVVYIDLDGFKAINDLHGHAVGDQFLLAVSAELKKSLRDEDSLARMGGDEFVAVLTDLQSTEKATLILQRLLHNASKPLQIDGLKLQTSASIGVTFYAQGEEIDADMLLRYADQAMYLAKISGKNQYCIFQAEEEGLEVSGREPVPG